MLKLINQQGLEEIIQHIPTISPLLNKTKTELENYLNFLQQGNYDLSESGTIDDQIEKYMTVLDKYDEISNRRTEIGKKVEELKKNIDEISNKVNKMLEFSGKKEEVDEIHDELIYKLMDLEDARCQKKKEQLFRMLRIKVKPKDIERLKLKNNLLDNCCVIYSMWDGYKNEEIYNNFLEKMKELNIDVFDAHVSGHADYTAFEQLFKITNPDAVIPIHTEKKEKIKEYTEKAVILEDMEVYEIKSIP